MSISTLSGVVYTNQATPMVSQVHNEHLAKTAFQSEMAKELFAEKEQEIEDIRPMEETSEIHPDGKGSGNDQDHPSQKEKKQGGHPPAHESASNDHLLDILA